ncbi:MAG: SagB/ThcOx family dehydrogenase [bacterium]
MIRKLTITVWTLVLALSIGGSLAIGAEQGKSIKLPAPNMEGGRPLMQVLSERKSTREFGSKELSLQDLSNLLWAGFGINRQDTGKRTAPSALNMQEMDIYVALEKGLYLYDAKNNELQLVVGLDIRGNTGEQPYVDSAPVNLIYVANLSKMGNIKSKDVDIYSSADAAYISENVYLYCASEGLATVVRGWINKESLSKLMRLRDDQKIIFAQSVGYPK